MHNSIVVSSKMTEKKKPLPVYLDDFERTKLEQITEKWGVSLSAAIKRLIRDAPS